MPNAFIYEYPSLSLIRVLKGGTERAYSAANFSADGTMLATVGSFPDYMLTVWDWNKEAIILRTKAFSQEVYRVSFSPRFPGQLVTSGTGHIRFWRMAQTFTGLKLQGDIGKFGQVELTDIEGYCELPDGKVLSGSDSGNLLLWEGNLIKCEIQRSRGSKCHDGAIQVVLLDGTQIITGGKDGHLRAWALHAIESAETTDELPIFEVEPEIDINLLGLDDGRNTSHIQTMLKGQDHWLVQDSAGGVYKVVLETGHKEHLFSFHSGAINDLDICPFNHTAATCGADGTVRLWDYVAKNPICTFRSPSSATTLTWAARAVDPEGRTLCAGYADGVVRVLVRCKDGLHLRAALKPHAVSVNAVAYSPDGNHLATGGADGCVFFIAVAQGAYSPIGFMTAPALSKKGHSTISPSVTVLKWSSDDTLYVGYSDGVMAELSLPMNVDTSETFALPFAGKTLDAGPIIQYRRAVAKAARLAAAPPAPEPALEEGEVQPEEEQPEPEEEEEIDFEAGAVAAILPLKAVPGEGRAFYITFANEPGIFWQMMWGGDKATRLSRHAAPLSYLSMPRSSQYLVSCSTDGSVYVGDIGSDTFWQGRVHGASPATYAVLSFDDAFLVSAGADGNLFVHKVS